MEDWKIKISVLWLIMTFGTIATPLFELYLPGFVEELRSGMLGGSQITPELILLLAVMSLLSPVMAFLSLILKDSMNRWANMILGIVFAGFALFFIFGYLAEQSAYYVGLILIGIVQFVVLALIVWYAWKSKQKA